MNRNRKIAIGVAVLGGLALLALSSDSQGGVPKQDPKPNPNPNPNPGPVPPVAVPEQRAGSTPEIVTVAIPGNLRAAPHDRGDILHALPVGAELVFVNPEDVEAATPDAPEGWIGVFLDGGFGWFSMAKVEGDADTILTKPVPANHPYFLR